MGEEHNGERCMGEDFSGSQVASTDWERQLGSGRWVHSMTYVIFLWGEILTGGVRDAGLTGAVRSYRSTMSIGAGVKRAGKGKKRNRGLRNKEGKGLMEEYGTGSGV